MTPLAGQPRFRSFSDPGAPTRPARPLSQPPQSPRLAGTRESPCELCSPVTQMPAGPRLDQKAPDVAKAGLEDHYSPYLTEECPSMEHSPLLVVDYSCQDAKGHVLVRQSEGAASATLPLVSRGFQQCSALLVRNMDTGNTWLGHHDSGSRAHWEKSSREDERPVSPATPRRGLIGRDRFGFESFMNEKGNKVVLLVESELGYDRREVMQKIVARGAVELQPLTLELGEYPDDSEWHLAYDPKKDSLTIHLKELLQSSVMHFAGLLTAGEPATCPDDKQSGQTLDIVEGLAAYKERCRKADLDEGTRAIVDACLHFAEVRNIDVGLAVDALKALIKLPGVPGDLLGMGVHPLKKDSKIVEILTDLVDRCLSPQV